MLHFARHNNGRILAVQSNLSLGLVLLYGFAVFAIVICADVVCPVVALHHAHCGAAIGTKIWRGNVPADKIAFGIVGATVERFARL